jgi:hypothetical protein
MNQKKFDQVEAICKEVAENSFGAILKWIFQVLAVSYSKEIPAGYVLKGKINTPGDLPGYICLSIAGLIKYAWELV